MATIKDGDYFIRHDLRPTSYPWDVCRRIDGRDNRITAFKTEVQARYYAAAQMIAKETESTT